MEAFMADKPTIQMKKRTNRIVLIAILIFVGCIIVRLFKLSVLDNKLINILCTSAPTFLWDNHFYTDMHYDNS